MGEPCTPSESHAAAAPAGRAWRRVWWWVRLIAVLGLLAGLVAVARPRELWQALAGTQGLWLLAGTPFALGAGALDALKLYALMKPHGYTGGWGSVLRTSLVVNVLSMFLPGTVGGGVVAWYRLSQRDGLRAQSLVALTVNTVVKLVVVCGAGAAALALDARARGAYAGFIPTLLLLGALPLLGLLAVLFTGVAGWAKRIHVETLGRWMPRRLHDLGRKLFESLESYRAHPLSVLGALGAGLGRKLLENVCFLFALWAVGAEVGFARVLWVMCAVEVAGMIPLTLGGLGLPQVTYVGLLAAMGLAEAPALASSIVSWAAFLPVYLAGAGILLAESLGRHGGGPPATRPLGR